MVRVCVRFTGLQLPQEQGTHLWVDKQMDRLLPFGIDLRKRPKDRVEQGGLSVGAGS